MKEKREKEKERKRELIVRRGKSKWGEEVEKKVGKKKNWPCWVSPCTIQDQAEILINLLMNNR